MAKQKFNNRERDILKIFWDSSSPLTVNDISEISGISKNTISPILKKLLLKNCIEVDNVVLSGKTLMRSYVAVVDREQFILDDFGDIKIEKLLNYFLEREDDSNTLPKIEQLIREKKDMLKKGDKE